MANPARKAPIASEMFSAYANAMKPKHVASAVRYKSSGFCADMRNTVGKNFLESRATTPMSNTAFSTRNWRKSTLRLEEAASKGRATTTMMSWTKRIPSMSWPCKEERVFLSWRIFTTRIVEERANARPTYKEASNDNPGSTKKEMRMVSST